MPETNFRALCAELVADIEEWMVGTDHRPMSSVELVDRAEAALAQPEPEVVTNETWRHELNERLWDSYKTVGYQGEEFMYDSDFGIAFDAICDAVLQRYARPTIEPVS